MHTHHYIVCLGSNYDRAVHMEAARKALYTHFADVRFSTELETEAIGGKWLSPFSNQVGRFTSRLQKEEVRNILKQIEKENGRTPEDKERGIVKIDIDLLMADSENIKPDDLKRDFVIAGLKLL